MVGSRTKMLLRHSLSDWYRCPVCCQILWSSAVLASAHRRAEFVYLTRWGTSSQWRSACSSCIRPRSNFLVPLTTHAAAFNTRCSLLVIDLGAPAKTRRHESVHECCSRLCGQWAPDVSQLTEMAKACCAVVWSMLLEAEIGWDDQSEQTNMLTW